MQKIILGGGGDENTSLESHKVFISLLPNKSKVLYIPIAMDPERNPYKLCEKWIKNAFKLISFGNIEMKTDLKSISQEVIKEYGGIYIGGGNTYKLLKLFRDSGFEAVLKEYIESGGVVYGGSAGAIILGADISTSDDENEVNIKDLIGLDVLNGYSVFCHYKAEQLQIIRKYVMESKKNAYAISEDSGILIRGKNVEKIGNNVEIITSE